MAWRSLVAALATMVLPGVALACPTCVSSAFGDRTFNWPYVALILMPFAVTAAIGGVIAYRAGYRVPRRRRLEPSPVTETETT